MTTIKLRARVRVIPNGGPHGGKVRSVVSTNGFIVGIEIDNRIIPFFT